MRGVSVSIETLLGSRTPWACSAGPAAVGICEDPGHVPGCVAVGDVVAAVVELLAAAQANLELSDAPTGDVHLQRDEGLPLGLGLGEQGQDLIVVEQQLAWSLGIVVVSVARVPGRNVGAH